MFNVPFVCKDHAKSLGARWNTEKKSWYLMSDNINIDEMVEMYGVATGVDDQIKQAVPPDLYKKMLESKKPEPVDLDIPYENKDEVKRLGARWDDAGKVWYTYKNHPNLTRMQALERRAAPRHVLKFIKHPAGFVAPTVDGND